MVEFYVSGSRFDSYIWASITLFFSMGTRKDETKLYDIKNIIICVKQMQLFSNKANFPGYKILKAFDILKSIHIRVLSNIKAKMNCMHIF